MSKYKYLYFLWVLPGIFLFLLIQQGLVYYGLQDTYQNGKSYTAEVENMRIKQVGAQTDGSIILRFKDNQGNKINKSMSLPVEMAGKLQKTRIVPIRYQPGAFQEVVIMTTYKMQKDLVWTNFAVAALGFLITLIIALYAHRYVRNKISGDDNPFVIERID